MSRITRGLGIFFLVTVAACGRAGDSMSAVAPAEAPLADEAAGVSAGLPAGARIEPPADGRLAMEQAVESTPLPPLAGGLGDPSRRIIKNADMSLEVEGIERALGRLETIAVGAGGYVLETRLDQYEGTRPSAVVGMAVPVDSFEDTLQRIRESGTRVLSEHASGTDVSQEYVDLQAQIANLEATQARVRAFLDDATSVEEALQVNAELTRLEGEISQRKGRVQYLDQRSAYSTIMVEIIEKLSDATPTPQPTRTPGPPWDPGDTVDDAVYTLGNLVRGLATLAIWLTIVILPIALPIIAVVWLVSKWLARRSRPPGAE